MTGPEFRARLISALERIATAEETLAAAVAADTQAPEAPPAICPPHPEGARVDFGDSEIAGVRVPDWQCRRCGYRTIRDEAFVDEFIRTVTAHG